MSLVKASTILNRHDNSGSRLIVTLQLWSSDVFLHMDAAMQEEPDSACRLPTRCLKTSVKPSHSTSVKILILGSPVSSYMKVTTGCTFPVLGRENFPM